MPVDVVNEESLSKGQLVMKTFIAELSGLAKVHKELRAI